LPANLATETEEGGGQQEGDAPQSKKGDDEEPGDEAEVGGFRAPARKACIP